MRKTWHFIFAPDNLLCGDILETLTIDKAGQGAQVAEIINRRGDRAVEGARLEIVCTPNKGTEGSNPSLSASKCDESRRWARTYSFCSLSSSSSLRDVDC